MMSFAYEKGLPVALDRGLVAAGTIDAAVRRVLDLKARLGLLAEPYRRCTGPDPAVRLDRSARARRRAQVDRPAAERRDAAAPRRAGADRARRAARRRAAEMLGPWVGTGRGEEAVGVLEGLRAALPEAVIEHEPGVEIAGDDAAGIPAAVAAAGRADRVILCIGEAAGMSGEAASRARIDLPGRQAALAAAVLDPGGRSSCSSSPGARWRSRRSSPGRRRSSPAGSPAARRGTRSPRS